MNRYLLYDAGCSTCSRAAKELEKLTDGWLTLRSLREPAIRQQLDEIEPNWVWRPMLLETDGTDTNLYKGHRMMTRMVQALGLRQAWQVAQAVGWEKLLGVATNTRQLDHSRRTFLTNTAAMLAAAPLLRFSHKDSSSVETWQPFSADSFGLTLSLPTTTIVDLPPQAKEPLNGTSR